MKILTFPLEKTVITHTGYLIYYVGIYCIVLFQTTGNPDIVCSAPASILFNNSLVIDKDWLK